ncbi:MAG: PAS domain-containing protein [Betaproteobacteria bacterium]|nr:PAS domain-containing protein [Betaproteobacteria bacterium]MBI2960238.1 PAS domain-containing protein [Betaproteobacteria bacterium]
MALLPDKSMFFPLSEPHRIARVNYAPRALAFAYILLIVGLLIAERGASAWVISFAFLQFVVYPHLAYLHTRVASDSKRAEMNNLLADALLLGAWTAQLQFPLWTGCGLLLGPSLNNAAHGGLRRLAIGLLLFGAGAAGWGAAIGFDFRPATGPLVTALSVVGIVGYASWIGVLAYDHNKRLAQARSALMNTEEQFRFVAEHEGELVSVLDENGRFRYASPSHRRYAAADAFAPGEEWEALVHADDRLQARLFLNLIKSNRSSERIQLRMFASNGTWQLLECRGNPVLDENGNTQMIVVVSRDVSARLRAEVDSQLRQN